MTIPSTTGASTSAPSMVAASTGFSATTALIPRPAFAAFALQASDNCGVWVTERDGLGMAVILVRRGQYDTLAQRWRDHAGTELPRGPKRLESGDLSIAGTGPESWLAIQVNGGNAFAASLRSRLADSASVIDQSDGYAVLRLGGPQVRATLAKLLPTDVHHRTFPVGTVAGTLAAQVGATLWRLADGVDGHPVFEIAVPRSMAGSFWHALTSSAAEFGLERRPINWTAEPSARNSAG